MTTDTVLSAARSPWRVVVVDDSPDDRAEVRRLLLRGSERRYRFTEAETGARALSAVLGAPDGPPDCLVIDYYLPDMDAPEVMKELKGSDGLPVCAVVVITGEVGPDAGRAVLRAGAQDYIGKDWLTPAGLTRVVENAVERLAVARQLRAQDAAIRESEERLRLALEASVTGMWSWDLQTDRLVWSAECCRIHAVADGRLETDRAGLLASVHADDRSRVDEALRDAVAGRHLYECEYRVVRPDGEVRWVADRGRAAYDGSDRPVRMLGTSTDVTERRQAEERARAGEADLVRAQAAAHLGSWRWDLTRGGVRWSEELYRIFGVDPRTFSPSNEAANRLVHPDDRARHLELVGEALSGKPVPAFECRIIRPDGEERVVLASGFEVEFDENERPASLFGTVLDITDRKRAEEALREGRAKLEAALASMTDAVSISDTEGRFVDFNDACATFHRFKSKEQCAGTLAEYPDILDLFLPGGEPAPLDQWPVARALRGETAVNSEYTLRRKDTGETWVGSYSFGPIRDETGAIVGSVSVGRDVTAERRAEEQLRRSEANLRSVLDDTRDVIYRVNLQNGQYEYISASAEVLTGFSREELLEFSAEESSTLIHPDDRPLVSSALVRLESAGQAEVEYRQRTKSGAYRWWSNHLSLTRDSAGRPLYRSGSIRDVTEKKATDAALLLNAERNQVLAETMLQGVVHQDAQGKIIAMNPAAERILGRSPDDLLGRSSVQLEHGTIREDGSPFPGLEHPSMVSLRTGEVLRGVVMGVFNPREEAYRWISVDAMPVIRPGGSEPTGVYTVFEDVTQWRERERALRESEHRYRELVQNANSAIIRWKCDGRISFINAYAERFFGYRTDELIGRPVTVLLPRTEGGAELGTLVQRILENSGEFVISVNENICSDGRRVWMAWTNRAMTDTEGQVVEILAVGSDITAQKQAEEALRMSEGRFRSFMANSPTACWVLDRGGRFRYANRSFGRLFSIDEAGVTDRSIDEVLGREAAGALVGPNETVFEKGHALETTESLRLPDGTTRSYLTVRFPMEGPRGEVLVGGTTLDITERERAEIALQKSEALSRAILDSLAEGIVFLGTDGEVRPTNPAAERMLHVTSNDVTGPTNHSPPRVLRSDLTPFSPDEMPGTVALRTGQSVQGVEMVIPRPDGEFRAYSVNAQPVRDDAGQVLGAVASYFDITARKQAEQALKERNEEVVRFAYTISHDLKSPLVTIRTFLGYLDRDAQEGKTERVRSDLGYIDRAAAKMSTLLEELLELSRIGRKPNPPEDVSLQTLVGEAVETVAGRLQERRIDLRVTQTPVLLRGERTRLFEVFQNLLENAVKFMGDQPDPRIEIGLDESGPELVFFVRDNGMGIDPRHHNKLFGLFEKLHPETEGTGMGLAIVKRIIEVHGGRIWAESAGQGHGTTFRFTLANVKRP
ncbi:MAG: PAS domain S-box protein [Isosphaeraceae bacterium]